LDRWHFLLPAPANRPHHLPVDPLVFRNAADDAGFGFAVTSVEGVVRYANTALCALTGKSLSALSGARIDRLFCERARVTIVGEVLPQAWQNRTWSGELRMLGPDDCEVATLLNVVTAAVATESTPLLAWLFVDIRVWQARLQESEQRFYKMAEVSPVVFWMVSPDWQEVSFISHAVTRVYGHNEEEFRDNPNLWIEAVHPDDRPRVIDFYDAHWGDETDLEYRIVRPDHSVAWLRDRTSPVRNAQGDILYLVGIAEDITKRKQDQEEKERLAAQLRHAQKMEAIGTLAGGIAHDFNNLIFATLGFAQMALEHIPKDSLASASLERIIDAQNRATDLVKQILTFSRQHEQKRMPIMLQPIIKESLKFLRASLPATIEIKRQISRECGAVLAEPTQFHQVVINLCTNAYHAMAQKGGVLSVGLAEIEVDAERAAREIELCEGRYACLTVSDTGCGMAPETLERIFEPYFTTRADHDGTGLGLATVHGIVKAHDGAITVETVLGSGSTFRVYLPCTDRRAVDIGERPSFARTPQGNGERILLVDDERAITAFLHTALENIGYTVIAFNDSRAAAKYFQANAQAFDLVLSDLTMPNLTGDRLAAQVLGQRPKLPVILLTGCAEFFSEAQARELGVAAYLMKPVSTRKLAEVIREVLDERSA
jgi:PAS domain S-box-containing protein